LFDSSGNRFYIKGVAYQEPGELAPDSEANQANGGFPEPSSFVDPLASPSSCTRDLPFLKDLGVNAVRVYSVDNKANHDECMKMLSDAGIYTIIDLSLPLNGSINRAAPAWTSDLLDLYIHTIDTFLKYDNVLAFNVGNEVINLDTNTNVGPFIKAAARDTKAYLKSKSSSILVGYSTVDSSSFRDLLVQYLTCDSEPVSIDIIGLNTYRWCGDSSIEAAGFDKLNQAFSSVPIPAYFSEFGCTKSLPRLWTEVKALLSPPMSDVWSGGAAFSYFPAQLPNFGLVTLSGPNNGTVTTNNDFALLKGQFGAATPPAVSASSVSNARTYPSCPPQTTTWLANSKLPPTPNDAVCSCLISNAFPCITTAEAANSPVVLGSLLDYGCSLLGQNGGSCSAIGDDGAAGTYGPLSSCDPATKLSYVFSQYFQSQKGDPRSCDFSGNATINAKAPTDTSALAQAQSSCVALAPGATFVPTAPSGSPGSSGTKGGSSGSGGSKPNSAFGGFDGIFGPAQITVVGMLLSSIMVGAHLVIGA
jgi:hypothetical protein